MQDAAGSCRRSQRHAANRALRENHADAHRPRPFRPGAQCRQRLLDDARSHLRELAAPVDDEEQIQAEHGAGRANLLRHQHGGLLDLHRDVRDAGDLVQGGDEPAPRVVSRMTWTAAPSGARAATSLAEPSSVAGTVVVRILPALPGAQGGARAAGERPDGDQRPTLRPAAHRRTTAGPHGERRTGENEPSAASRPTAGPLLRAPLGSAVGTSGRGALVGKVITRGEGRKW